MITVPPSFRAMPRWWHDEDGRAWLDELPTRVEAQCRRWDLVLDGPPRHGSNALVVPVRRGDEPAALRLAPPGDDVAAEVAALSHWAGRGVVLVLDAEPTAGACLLERLDPTRSLGGVAVLEATAVLGDLTRTLAVPAPPDVPSTRDLAAGCLDGFPRAWRELDGPTPRTLLDRAVAAAAELAQQPTGRSSVDGDLHPEQVLAGQRLPWVVVDPVLLRGDPEHDVGRVLWSRLDELPRDQDVRTALATFVEHADVPAERARSWVVVRSMAYLLWGLQHGLTEDPPRCRRLLDLFT